MQTHEIIKRFRDHFQNAGHTVVPSASLILDDPNLLFVNAGMVQFKPYFLGEAPPPYPRATSIQKCVRTGDIDEVGKTDRHNTFFQMAGNFSFGDYFKEGAITHAWQLITGSQDDGNYGFDPDRIWVTVYETDDEAIELWQKIAGLPPERIQRRDGKDNYWDMGIPGPGGPCSEIYYDRGPEHGVEGGPVADENRYLEIWNLVFMQDIRGELSPKEGHSPIGTLPAKNIDTGMGVERVATLLQGVNNVYETDLVRSVISKAEEFSGHRYGLSHPDDVRFRIIADHSRSSVMLIGDGVTPGNEGRGYVLRRLLRRIVRSARLLGVHEPVLGEFGKVVRDEMGPSYPELVQDFGRIEAVLRQEESSFLDTLTAGSRIFDLAATDVKKAGGSTVPGDKAFQLHDTFGFPIELTLEMAEEQGLTVDEGGFRRLMTEQRTRAKADAALRKTGHGDASAYRAVLEQHGRTNFLGYRELTAESRVVGLLVEGVGVPAAGEGAEVEVVLDRTPFYAEGGGQQPDHGTIVTDTARLDVHDVQSPVPGLTVHRAKVISGEILLDSPAHAEVEVSRRRAISRSHTATHLVHAGIRKAMDGMAAQAGSLNAPGRLRFDFTSPTGAVPPSVLAEVEEEVNDVLLHDIDVRAEVMSMEDARKTGAVALFGEKYGDEVRVVTIGDYSRELCGGTHVARIGEIGLVKLLSEASVAAGVRRVDALVGLDAFRFLAREHTLVSQLAEQFKTKPEDLPERIGQTVEKLRTAEKELERLRGAQLLSGAGDLAKGAEDVRGVALVAAAVPDGIGGNDLRNLVTEVRNQLGSRPGVVALFSSTDGKVSFVVATTATARERNIAAGKLVQAFAPAIEGRGGGKPDMAQGGGSNPAGVSDAITGLRVEIDRLATG